MNEPQRFTEVKSLLRSREQLLDLGWSDRSIMRAVASGEVIKLSRVRLIRRDDWEKLWPERKLLARVLATLPLRQSGGVYGFESAAVVHGLPLYGFRGRKAQLLVPNARSSAHSSCVERHVARADPADYGALWGIPCTSLTRTLLDLACVSSRDLALVCLDAALRVQFPVRRGSQMPPEAREWLRSMSERLKGERGKRGKRRALSLLSIADGGAESVLESVARLRLIDLGYRVRTQVPVSAEAGRFIYPDIELLGAQTFVEVDGRVKYVDPELRQQGEPVDVLLAEKRREATLRGVTGKAVVRVEAGDLLNLDTMRAALRRSRVPPPV